MNVDPEARERVASGKAAGGRHPLPSEVRSAAMTLGKDLRERFGRMDRPMAEQVARLVRNSVVVRRRPGRRTTDRVLKAAEMRRGHVPWMRVYREVLPGFSKMTVTDRF